MAKLPSLSTLLPGLMHIVVILVIALVITLGSYVIVTRRDTPMDPKAVAVGQYSLTGEYLVTLPCATAYENYDSSNPKLPEARGIPFNYNYYNPCDGHKILRDGFLKDVGIWLIITSIVYSLYVAKKNKSLKSA
jgi:hypothetical protein